MEKNIMSETDHKNCADPGKNTARLTRKSLTTFFDRYFELKEFCDNAKKCTGLPDDLRTQCQSITDGFDAVDMTCIDRMALENVQELCKRASLLNTSLAVYLPEETDNEELFTEDDDESANDVTPENKRRSLRVNITIALIVFCVIAVVLALLVPMAWVQNALGSMYYYGRLVKVDYTEAERWFRKGAEAGNAKAQYNLGMCYDTGHGIKQDYVEAVVWYRKAAEQDHELAQLALGKCLEEGLGVPHPDYAEAVKWYEKSAKQDVPEAQYRLALYYEKSEELENHYQKAFRYFRKAAEQDYIPAQCKYARYLELGLGTTKDQEKAIEYYRKAIEKNDAHAQYYLALILSDNKHTETDKLEAADLMRQSANSGYSDAQYELGRFYENGIGVKESKSQAMRWYIKAAEKGHQQAREAWQKLSGEK